MINKKIFWYAMIFFIVVLSYFFYSSRYYAILNSDDAVSILMLHYFKWPDDLYFWGQDRYGSFIPLTGQFLFRIFNLSAINAESVTHYFFLILGYAGFASLFRKLFTKIIFAIVWFFPPLRMIDLLHYNLGLEYSLIGTAILFFSLMNNKRNGSKLTDHLYLTCLTLCFISAFWLSELAAITIGLFLLFRMVIYFRKNSFRPLSILKKKETWYALSGLLVAFFFISMAKDHSVRISGYNSLNHPGETITALKSFAGSVFDFFVFRTDEFFTSVYAYLLAAVLLMAIYQSYAYGLAGSGQWLLFFCADAVLILTAVMISEWALLNGVPRRFFIPLYISGWMAFLLSMELLSHPPSGKKALRFLLLAAVITGGAGALYNIKYIWPATLRPRAEIAMELKSLGNIGIISEYWNSYINACVDPDNIKATPHDAAEVRNKWMAEAVFRQKNIYLIKDMWLEQFPDTISQFGHRLVRSGSPFIIGDSNLCRYVEQK